MKKVLFLSLFVFCKISNLVAQDNYQYFALIYSTGDNWNADKPFSEQAYSSEHSQFLSTLRKEGKIAIGGRYSDKGFIVLKVKNEDEANELIAQDLSLTHQTFKAELFPFSTFYYGCLEKNE